MIVTWLLCALNFRQGQNQAIYFVRKDSIYKSAQGRETLIVSHAISPAVSPDEKHLAFIREGDLYLCDPDNPEPWRGSRLGAQEHDLPDHDLYPSWDPTSQYVIFSHADRFGITRRGESVHPMFGSEHAVQTIWNVYWSWPRKGESRPDLSLFLGNETTGTSVFSVVSSFAASFSPNGKKVAFCRNGDLWMATLEATSILDAIREASWDEARVLPIGTQEGGTRPTNETSSIFRISWSPDGKLLALSVDRYSSTGSPQVIIVNADKASEKVASFSGSDACFLDSNHILYVKPYTKSTDIWVRSLDTQDEKVLISHGTDPAVVGR